MKNHTKTLKEGILVSHSRTIKKILGLTIALMIVIMMTLLPVTMAGNGTGLKGDYYSGDTFNTFKFSRTDAQVNFTWVQGTSPGTGLNSEHYSIWWTGKVQPLYSETYTFYTNTDDGVRLWVNGQLLVDNWAAHYPEEHSGTITLIAGQLYDIKMAYYNGLLGGLAQLSWSSPSQAKGLIPQSQLYTSAYDSNAYYKIINKKSGRGLSCYQGGTANNTNLVLYDYLAATDQNWRVVDTGNGYYKLVNQKSGRLVSCYQGGTANGTNNVLYDDGSASDQYWLIAPGSAGYLKLINQKSDRALSCDQGGTANNTQIHLWDYLGGYDDQDWSIMPIGSSDINVDANTVIANVTRNMTGACIEDVNHELYGGIDSQMIFGDSFQEPAGSPGINGFTAYGGDWLVSGSELRVTTTGGPKLVLNNSDCTSGEVGVDVYLDGSNVGQATELIIKVSQPAIGADNFYGYEIGLSSGNVRIGKHQYNWQLISDTAYNVPMNTWITLKVTFTGNTITVFVNGTQVTTYMDPGPLNTGALGLRSWAGPVRFRNMYKIIGGTRSNIPFVQNTGDLISNMWQAVRKGSATGSLTLDTASAFKGTQSQKIIYSSGSGEIGIENQSLNRWGMNFQSGNSYDGFVYLRSSASVPVYAALESVDGTTVYAETSFTVNNSNWTKYSFTLTPNANDTHGRFAIKLKQAGTVWAGYAFLQPGTWGRYNGLPVRKDVGDGLVAQGLTVMRFGGSMVNHTQYRWKNFVGPRESRPVTGGCWYSYETNGWGISEFLNYTEQAGILGIPDLNSFETSQDMADFIDYANGPTTTTWGQKRANDGHSAPYNLKYLQIGNEEAVDQNYYNRFASLAPTIWAKDPNIILVVGDFHYDNVITDPYNFTGGAVSTLAAHKQILDLAKSYNREVWFDIHIWTEDPPQPTTIDAADSFSRQLGNISPGVKYKVVVFEFNANSHDLARALSNANGENQLERMGDRFPIICSANCLQPDGQNDNGWDQGLLFLNPQKVWAQPPYYVTQMNSNNYQPFCVKADTAISKNDLSVTATRSANGATLVLKVVNLTGSARTVSISIAGFSPTLPTAHVTKLTGALTAVNTSSNPNNIVPVESDWTHNIANGVITYTFEANSFTILKLQ
jgi:hypothetical protein